MARRDGVPVRGRTARRRHADQGARRGDVALRPRPRGGQA
ncbi:hypothetical protein, partial [Rhodoplanes roseus]